MRFLSFDTRGFFFALKLMVVVFTMVGVARVGFGMVLDTSPGVAMVDAPAPATEDSLVTRALERLSAAAEQARAYGPFSGSVRAAAISDFIPAEGLFLGVDLPASLLTVYENGLAVRTMDILHAPERGSADAIPTGLYVVEELERESFSQVSKVYLPDRIRFDDRFSIHGPPYTESGSDEESTPASGFIELKSEDAARLFDMVEQGTTLYVLSEDVADSYGSRTALALEHGSLPALSARSFEIADAITGEVYLEKNADKRYPIASVTKLMTALVAHSTYGINEEVEIPGGERYVIGDLYYPLFLRSDNGVAHAIAAHGGTPAFLARMNTQARALGMYHTSYQDSSGLSPKNISTAHDLLVLGQYLYREKRFLLEISGTDRMTITSSRGHVWNMKNQNKLASDAHFVGGKLGYTDEAGQTSLALFTVPVDGEVRVVAVVILKSQDWKQDTRTLLTWFQENARAVE